MTLESIDILMYKLYIPLIHNLEFPFCAGQIQVITSRWRHDNVMMTS